MATIPDPVDIALSTTTQLVWRTCSLAGVGWLTCLLGMGFNDQKNSLIMSLLSWPVYAFEESLILGAFAVITLAASLLAMWFRSPVFWPLIGIFGACNLLAGVISTLDEPPLRAWGFITIPFPILLLLVMIRTGIVILREQRRSA